MIAIQTVYEENLIKIVRALPPMRAQQVLEFALFMQERIAEPVTMSAFPVEHSLDAMRLPLAERSRLLALQAEQILAHYDQSTDERELWQGGDIGEY